MNEIYQDHNQIRILLADDEPVILEGIKSWIVKQSDLRVIETAQNHDDVVRFSKLLQPDVIILDIRMPGNLFNAQTVVRELRKENAKQPKIIMYSGHWGREFIDHYLKLGATGFLAKVDGSDYILEAIRAVIKEEIYYGRRIFKWINQPKSFPNLTTREFEVIRRIAGGHSNSEIADSLCITSGTARVHVSAILKKLNVNTRGKLIVLALMNGIEPYEPPELDTY